MANREFDERGYHPDFPYRKPPIVVEGIGDILDLIGSKGKRTMLDLNMLTQSLPLAGKQALEQAIWKVVEYSSKHGVLPLIIPVDREGNLGEHSKN